MALTAWRQFNFFDLTPIRDPSTPLGDLLYSDPSLTALCPGRDSVFFGTAAGEIKEFGQDCILKRKFTAYERDWTITHLKFLTGTSLLLSIGINQGHPPLVYLWDLDKPNNSVANPQELLPAPHLHSTVKVSNSSNVYPLTSFAISSSYSILAFGFADGTVVLSRGDIIHDRGTVQRVVYSGNGSSPITGLEFYEDSGTPTRNGVVDAQENQQQPTIILLYVSSLNQVFTLPTNGKNAGKPEMVLDKNKGGPLGCVTKEYNKLNGQLIVARDDEVQFYGPRKRGSSFVFDIPKKLVYAYKQYILFTTSESSSKRSDNGSNNNNNSTAGSLLYSDTTRVFIVDTVNKYVAFNGQISLGVKYIFEQWGRLNILGSDGILYSLEEKPLNVRIDLLKSRNLYGTAIKLIDYLNADDSNHTISKNLELSYADYLYQEGEFELAVSHYINAIDLGQTSHVILKYRDSTHISLLTRYLEALHDSGKATKEHTTLLLNSYAKLKDLSKLTEFIEHGLEAADTTPHFDFETAIKICRQAGYFNLATYLAKKYNDSDLVVSIKLKDLHDYRGCLSYLKSLQVSDALRILIQESRLLLDQFPMETTALLIELFTGKFVPQPEKLEANGAGTMDAESQHTEASSTLTAPVVQSYRAFVNYMSTYTNAGSLSMDSSSAAASTTNGSTSAAAGNGFASVMTDTRSQPNGNGNGTTEINHPMPTYQPPKPRLIFASFARHPNEFVIFLEACIESYDEYEAQPRDKRDLVNTLFEMYLHIAKQHPTGSAQRKEWEGKAQNLVHQFSDLVDQNTIFLLSHLMNFHDGELMAREKEDGFQVDLFRFCMATGDIPGAVEVLHKYGDKGDSAIDNELYPLALQFFSSSESRLEQAGEAFGEVIGIIKKHKLMSPLQVVQTLSANSVVSLGDIRGYLIDVIDSEKQEIDRNRKLTELYQKETQEKKDEIKKILNDPIIVQYTVCSSCGSSLDLPAVHFACKHSYHQRCLNASSQDLDESLECPECMSEMENIKAVRYSQTMLAERNDLFTSTLNESDAKFRVISDFISRGALTSI